MERELPTRATLIERLGDRGDDASWTEFAEVYTPLLFGFCKNAGMPSSDTADVVQEVMRSVSIAMASFQYDPAKGSFRSWLFTALRNEVNRHWKKASKRPLTSADPGGLAIEPSTDEAERWDRDYQQQMLRWAIEKIRGEFEQKTFRAFEETALQEKDPLEVASALGMRREAVAVAKHRVMKRLREKIESIDAEAWEQSVTKKDELS